MAFPPGFLDELRARLSLSEVVGRKVSLKRRSGAEYAGLCPFHNEKTPSFTVNEKKGFFYCFGCHEKGDAVGFVMKTEGLSFPEAVEKLAREVNLPVPRSTPVERERAERVSTLQQVVEEAARWFQKQLRLPVGRQGLDYLRGRGLEDATIDDFRLGFAPDSRDGLLAHLKRENVPIDKIVEAGLAIQPEDSSREPYDRFRGRVMFAINDRRGRVIAFGGRVMGAGEPKYLNSPETPLFHKGANLYCLDRARQAATKDQPVIVAEGYMDVIALHGAGFTGAVAPLGTALTEGQLAELWKLADEPYLCFDGDNAGRRAANRAAERALPLLRNGKSLRFLSLPAGEDPDSLIRTRGADAIRRSLDLAQPLSQFLFAEIASHVDMGTEEGRARFLNQAKPLVAQIEAPALAAMLRRRMAELARLDAAEIEALVPSKAPAKRGPASPPARTLRRQQSLEAKLLARVLQRPDLASVIPAEAVRTTGPEAKALIAALAYFGEDATRTAGQASAYFEGSEHEAIVREAMADPLLIQADSPDMDIEGEVADFVKRLRQSSSARRAEELVLRIQAGDATPEDEAEYRSRHEQLKVEKSGNPPTEERSKL
jgi:DNA primase